MGDHTGIAWTQATWNPWHGCTKVSAGCDHCYMFREKKRYGQDPNVVQRSKTKFAEPLKWAEPRLIFTCSWSDWFHRAADAWREEAWDVIRRTPQHTYQILTKRPGRIARHLPAGWGEGWPNVWLGVSVETQDYVRRAEVLRNIPARVRFISAEPLLDATDFTQLFRGLGPDEIWWLIAGGESGPGCRPMDLQWVRDLRDQCGEYGVHFFLKQLGGWPDARAHEKAVLDGQTWTEMPELARA